MSNLNQVIIKLIGNYSYQTSHCLGEGVYGKVYEGVERDTKEKVAIKKVDLNTFTNDKYLENAIFSQIYLLKRFNHPNIVKFKDVLSSKNSLYIITEFCKHGDLKEMIKRKRFKDEQAFQVVRQISCGFYQLTQEKIVHRDLKPANILIHEGVYKIGDFGFAKYVDNFSNEMLKSCVGSPIYMAPQVLERLPYTTKCDIWSIGVMFFEMLFGCPPWKARDEKELTSKIKSIPITTILKRENISPKAAEFLRRCLAYNEDERFSWNELFDMFMVRGIPEDVASQEGTRIRYMTSLGNQQRSMTPTKSKKQGQRFYVGGGHSQSPILEKKSSSNLMQIPMTGQGMVQTSQGIVQPTQQNSPSSLDLFKKVRDQCTYKNFLCIQLLTNLDEIRELNPQFLPRHFKIIYMLSLSTRIRNNTTLSLLYLCLKLGKQYEQLHLQMTREQQTYDEFERDIEERMQEQLFRKMKEDLMTMIGAKNQGLTDEKVVKLEQLLLEVAYENMSTLFMDLKKKGRIRENTTVLQLLEWQTDIIHLCSNRGLIEVSIVGKNAEDADVDYSQKVIQRVQRLLTTKS